jgi:hypothetical protein
MPHGHRPTQKSSESQSDRPPEAQYLGARHVTAALSAAAAGMVRGYFDEDQGEPVGVAHSELE